MIFFDEKSKTGLGFDIRQPEQKFQHRPTLQSMANPAVISLNRKLVCFLSLSLSLSLYLPTYLPTYLSLSLPTYLPLSLSLSLESRCLTREKKLTLWYIIKHYLSAPKGRHHFRDEGRDNDKEYEEVMISWVFLWQHEKMHSFSSPTRHHVGDRATRADVRWHNGM